VTTQSHDDVERFIQENEHEIDPEKPPSFFNHTDCRICGPGPLKQGAIPSQWPHIFLRSETVLHSDYDGDWREEIRTECGPSLADLVSSELKDERGWHTIALDIDMPAALLPSSTPDHYHLYIDHKMPWRRYRKLLRALYKAGLIEHGYYYASKRRRATHLRPPWRKK
jgi:hypothetical protein